MPRSSSRATRCDSCPRAAAQAAVACGSGMMPLVVMASGPNHGRLMWPAAASCGTCEIANIIKGNCLLQVPYPNNGPWQFGLQWWTLMFEVRQSIIRFPTLTNPASVSLLWFKCSCCIEQQVLLSGLSWRGATSRPAESLALNDIQWDSWSYLHAADLHLRHDPGADRNAAPPAASEAHRHGLPRLRVRASPSGPLCCPPPCIQAPAARMLPHRDAERMSDHRTRRC